MSNANLGVRIVLEDGAKAGFDALGLSALGLGQSLYGLVGIWNQLGDAGKGAALGVGLLGLAFHGMMDIEKEAIDAAMEFNTAMNEIELSVNGAAEADTEMQHTLVSLADAGVYSTTQLAHGFAQLGIDGWNARQIMDSMGAAAMYMGEAMRSDTTPAFNLLGTAMEMFHANAAEATQYANDLTFAFYNGQKTVANLQQALNMVGPAAHQLHVPFGELMDVLALLGEAGLKGSQGAASLQYYLTNLTSPTDRAAEELKKLGVSVYDSHGHFIGLTASIEALGPALSKLTEKDRAQAIANLFNIRSGRDAREFFADFVATINKIGTLDQLRQGTDVLQKAASVTDTLSGSMQRLGSTVRDSFKFIGDAQVGPLTDIINGLQNFAHQFNMAGDAVHTKTTMFFLLATAMTGLAFVVGAVGLVILLFGSAIATIAPYVAGVVAIVAGLIASFIIAKQAIESNTMVMGALRAILGVIAQAWSILIQEGQKLLQSLRLLAPVWDVLKVILAVVAGIIVGVLLGAVLALIGIFIALAVVIRVVIQVLAVIGTAVGHFFSLLGTGIRALPAVWNQVWTTIRTTALNIWNGIIAGVTSFVNGIRTGISNGFNAVITAVRTALNTVVGWFQWLYQHNYYFQMLVDFIRDRFNTARANITLIWNTITGWLSMTWNTIVNTARNLWNLLVGAITAPLNRAHNSVTSTGNSIRATLQAAWNAVVTTAQTAWNRLVAVVAGVVGPIIARANSIKTGVVAAIQSLGGLLFQSGQNAIHMLAQGIEKAAGAVIQKAKDIAAQIARILGFHSPPKEGPLADSDTYMPNMMKMYASGIESHLPLVHSASGKVATALSGNAGSIGTRFNATSGGSSGGGTQHIHLNVDGKEMAEVVLDALTGQFQQNGMSRAFR